MDIGLNARVAEGPGQDSIEVASEHGEAVGRNGGAVPEIAIGAPIEFAHLDIGSRRLDDLKRLRNNFLANPVSGNYRDTLLRRFLRVHGKKLTQAGLDE
jgi:hypothetical protein